MGLTIPLGFGGKVVIDQIVLSENEALALESVLLISAMIGFFYGKRNRYS